MQILRNRRIDTFSTDYQYKDIVHNVTDMEFITIKDLSSILSKAFGIPIYKEDGIYYAKEKD